MPSSAFRGDEARPVTGGQTHQASCACGTQGGDSGGTSWRELTGQGCQAGDCIYRARRGAPHLRRRLSPCREALGQAPGGRSGLQGTPLSPTHTFSLRLRGGSFPQTEGRETSGQNFLGPQASSTFINPLVPALLLGLGQSL